MKLNIILITLIFLFFSSACSKKIGKISETTNYIIHPEKMTLVGVNEITLNYSEREFKGTAFLKAKPKKVLSYILDLNNFQLSLYFSKLEVLEKVEFSSNKKTFFSISNNKISYSFNSSKIKTFNMDSTPILNLTNEEKMLALIFTSLYFDLQSFKQNEGINKFKFENIKNSNSNYFLADIEIGCYQIGGSQSAVQERLKDCSKPGCSIIGRDISCLWGNHACFGSVTYSCQNTDASIDFDNSPHFFWN